ncbi:hypothetical protein CCYA_CCYA20G4792 [Cyanidiococcus yangmingshanensis]|nr:hypothetical protein CCYA_CCYA20G4792 [Cyanidiococcus yangmingshanensis]
MLSPDCSKVVAVFDADYFYCQIELNESGDETLRAKPVAVFQKHVVVTCNYEARGFGIRKLMSLTEAKRLCPELVLFCGEDLTPYRAAQERICEALEEELQRLSGTSTVQRCETVGLDEYIVDLTGIVEHRLSLKEPAVIECCGTPKYVGAVFPRDFGFAAIDNDRCLIRRLDEHRLAIGSDIVCYLRRKIFDRTKVTVSGGVAFNKMLAKLAANMRKPDGQTCFVPSAAADAWLRTLDLRVLPCVGRRLERLFSESFDIRTVDELRYRFHSPDALEMAMRDAFGPYASIFCKHASTLWFAAHGDFNQAVRPRALPRSIHIEESSRGWKLPSTELLEKLHAVALGCAMRVKHEAWMHFRIPRKIAVYWRQGKGARRSRSTAICARPWSQLRKMAVAASPNFDAECGRILFAHAREIFLKNTEQHFDNLCTLIGVGVSNFVELDRSWLARHWEYPNGSERDGMGSNSNIGQSNSLDSMMKSDERCHLPSNQSWNECPPCDDAGSTTAHHQADKAPRVASGILTPAASHTPHVGHGACPRSRAVAKNDHVLNSTFLEIEQTLGKREHAPEVSSLALVRASSPLREGHDVKNFRVDHLMTVGVDRTQKLAPAPDIRRWTRAKSSSGTPSTLGPRALAASKRGTGQRRSFLDRWLASGPAASGKNALGLNH